KLVAAWPDGNEWSGGAGTRVFGWASREDGRSTSIAALRPVAARSATATASTVRTKTLHRRQRSPSTSAMPIQSSPNVPAYDSPSKTGFSQPARWWTTQRSRWRSAPNRSGGHDLLRLLDQRAKVERLADEALRAAFRRFVLRCALELAAEHDDGNRSDSVLFLYAAQHLPAVDLRHHHVEEDQIRRVVLDRLESLLGVARLDHRVALDLQVDPHDLADLRIVVDDEDERPARRLPRARAFEERVEVSAPVSAMPSGRVERRHAPEVGPLADRALRDAEVLGGLPERQPFGIPSGSPARTAARLSVAHRPRI